MQNSKPIERVIGEAIDRNLGSSFDIRQVRSSRPAWREFAKMYTYTDEDLKEYELWYSQCIKNYIDKHLSGIFYSNTYNPFGGSITNSANLAPDPDPPTKPSGETLATISDEVKKLKEDNTQLWDAVREIVAENNQLKDKLNELLKALGAKESNGPIVSNPGHYRATGYYQEG